MTLEKTRMLEVLSDTGLYLVTEDAVPSDYRLRSVERALEGGARVVQLRDKGTPMRTLLEEARSMRALCARYEAVFIVNDDAALAWACDSDGLHIGQDDLPAVLARRLLGPEKLIGLSVSALSEAQEADALPVDYIGVGAIHATPTKIDAELGGLDLLRAVRLVTAKPLVGIGGIDVSNAAEVFLGGADAVAVVRAVFGHEDVTAAVRRFLEVARAVRGSRGGR